ncbi:MAG: hypothetical protein S0880_32795 [Actinomycetota bacterium]|nr:hypothetical protein [Actinomycetota bacterium]
MRRIVIPLAVTPALFFGTAAVATANSAECAIDEITTVVGMDPREDENVDGVRVVVEGAVPADIGRTVSDTAAELMTVTRPIRTAVEPTIDGAIVTVRGVTGDLPPELGTALSQATGCLADDTEDGASEADEPAAAEPAGMECRITSIVPVDAEGEATTLVSEVEGAIVSVAGPLPVGAEATVAEVFSQAGAAGSDVAVQIVQGADGIQAEVEGVAGPLPADLSTELATALNCSEAATEPAPGGNDPNSNDPNSNDPNSNDPNSNDPNGDGSTDDPGSPAVLAADQAISSLPRTGGDSQLLYGAGSAFAVAALAIRRFLTRM